LLVLPITYFAILRAAADPKLMGKHVNRRLQNVIGWLYFVLVCLTAAAAVPLLILTDAGKK
jgi:Mn2+/Fe2+ NRAMP family transporter